MNTENPKKENIETLQGKLIITGEIIVKTGLAIGGNKSGIDIGGMDNPVVKTNKGAPYIPGSTLKGKMRALLARVAGSEDVKADLTIDENSPCRHLAKVFGIGANEAQECRGEALLKVRDAYIKDYDKTMNYTEEKMENTIDRVKGNANPRPIERVVPETIFEMNLCLDIYDENEAKEHAELINLAIELIKQDYLGGGGTRGNGRVDFDNLKYKYLKVTNYNLTGPDLKVIKSLTEINLNENESNNTEAEA